MQQLDFSGWSLYTGPSFLKNIISDPNCPWVVGQWDGINKDTSAAEIKNDIEARILFFIDAFKKILPKFKTINRHFVVPEFYFRCKQGPYPYIKVDGLNYPFEYIKLRIQTELQKIIPKDSNTYTIAIGSVLTSNIADYSSFLSSSMVTQRMNELNAVLATGNKTMLNHTAKTSWFRNLSHVDKNYKDSNDLTALNNFMKLCRANPLCTVRNRGVYYQFNQQLSGGVATYVYEKQYESTVDLTMGVYDPNNKITHGGMLTEWMANYPSYSTLKGDKQIDKFSTNARFTPALVGNYDVGVEICLDHRLQRLRRTVDMTVANGADANNYPIIRQLIPSGGMQIIDYSVATDKASAIFNADGCDKIYVVYGDESTVILNGQAGIFTGITCGVFNKSIQSKWIGKDGNTYYSHSQLAFPTQASVLDGYNNALYLNNKKAITNEGTAQKPFNIITDSFKQSLIKLGITTDLFAATTGELHYYEPF